MRKKNIREFLSRDTCSKRVSVSGGREGFFAASLGQGGVYFGPLKEGVGLVFVVVLLSPFFGKLQYPEVAARHHGSPLLVVEPPVGRRGVAAALASEQVHKVPYSFKFK